jgi:hypothetical protein
MSLNAPRTLLVTLLLAAVLSLSCSEKQRNRLPPSLEPGSQSCPTGALPRQDFIEVPAPTSTPLDLAADFTVPTLQGDWNFKQNFTGCDTFLFIQDAPTQSRSWPTPLWARDVDTLLQRLPLNTHVFFVSGRELQSDRLHQLEALKAQVGLHIAPLQDHERLRRQARVHYITARGGWLDNWLGSLLSSSSHGVGIDRFQQIRTIGSYADPRRWDAARQGFEPNLSMAANEAIYYNFEATREARLTQEDATLVEVFTGERVEGGTLQNLELPPGEDLSSFDTLSLDLTMTCEHASNTCPAGEDLTSLSLCDLPDQDDNRYAHTPCQPHVPEAMGSCLINGSPTGVECKTHTDCAPAQPLESGSEWTCSGYSAAVAADTRPGDCTTPFNEPVTGSHTCLDDGSGYGTLQCPCDTELGRWAPPCGRSGRWVSDVSPLLPLLARGGRHEMRFTTEGPCQVDLTLRLTSEDKSAPPTETRALFSGDPLNPERTSAHAPITMTLPADARKVELVTRLSGHGGSAPGDCAALCDIPHHFTLNERTSDEVVRTSTEAGSLLGCMEQVSEGTLPNQYGTWWYGRSGWCPGKEVPTLTTDITRLVTLGAENTFHYRALFEEHDIPSDAEIRLQSWVVISR